MGREHGAIALWIEHEQAVQLEAYCHPGGEEDDDVIADNEDKNGCQAANKFGDKSTPARIESEVSSGIISDHKRQNTDEYE